MTKKASKHLKIAYELLTELVEAENIADPELRKSHRARVYILARKFIAKVKPPVGQSSN